MQRNPHWRRQRVLAPIRELIEVEKEAFNSPSTQRQFAGAVVTEGPWLAAHTEDLREAAPAPTRQAWTHLGWHRLRRLPTSGIRCWLLQHQPVPGESWGMGSTSRDRGGVRKRATGGPGQSEGGPGLCHTRNPATLW